MQASFFLMAGGRIGGRDGRGCGRGRDGRDGGALESAPTEPITDTSVPVVPSSSDCSISHSVPPVSASSSADASSTSGRPQLRILEGSFIPGHQAAAQITKTFKEKFDKEDYIWKKKFFEYDPLLESVMKRVWEKVAGKRYSDLLCGWRKDNKKPPCVGQDTWNNWQQMWNDPEFKRKCQTASKNCLSEVAGAEGGPFLYTGGSRSAIEHGLDLAKQLGRPSNDFEIFNKMHKIKSDGSYIDKRSRDVAGMIEARRAATAEVGTEEIHLDMSQLYMDVVGQKKQWVYGLGHKLPSSQTANSSATSINELERIRSEARDEGRAEARAELLQQMEEMSLKQQQIEEEMRQKQQQMAEEMRKK